MPLTAGLALLYVGVHVAANWASYALGHRFFGMSPRVVFAVDDYVIWGSISLVVGAIVGGLMDSRPILAAFLTCLVSASAYVVSAMWDGSGVQVLALYREPLVASVAFSSIGATLGARMMRSDQSLQDPRGK